MVALVEDGRNVVMSRPQNLLQMIENEEDTGTSLERVAQKHLEELFCIFLSRDETVAQVDEWTKLAVAGKLEKPREIEALSELIHHGRIGSPRSPPSLIQEVSSSWNGKKNEEETAFCELPSPYRKLNLRQRTPHGGGRKRSGSIEDEETKFIQRWKQAANDWNKSENTINTNDDLPLLVFAPLAAELCDLPMIAGPLIFARLAASSNTAKLQDFLSFWRFFLRDRQKGADRLFQVLVQPQQNGIRKEDLEPLLRFVVTTHPGLAFLEEHAEFQAKYSATVIARIFYRINLSRTGQISRRELCLASPDLIDALYQLESTDDVNAETCFFSYEHFYVLYCQFWELDADKDAKITRSDLLKYGGHRLSRAIVDRVFDAAPRPFADGGCGATQRRKTNQTNLTGGGGHNNSMHHITTTKIKKNIDAQYDLDDDDTDEFGELRAHYRREEDEFARRSSLGDEDIHQADAMTYADFVYFMLSEEDKGNEASLRYWFTCVDVDGDGFIDAADAKHFYDVQAQRMECLGHEVVPLEDVLCQMADLLHSGTHSQHSLLRLSIQDFLHPSKIRIAGVFFDALFSLDKFVAFEQRDPFAERLKRDDPFDFEWERFAAHEYSRLATEDDDEEDDDASGGSGEVLDIDDSQALDDRYNRRGGDSLTSSNEAPF
mmetsp:Transcript_3043/g.3974  ORF Transcript_3043/g.3974 Transcript_3043/m.3974 type:complete len:661 (-) Transcript_3043:961-2943(-)